VVVESRKINNAARTSGIGKLYPNPLGSVGAAPKGPNSKSGGNVQVGSVSGGYERRSGAAASTARADYGYIQPGTADTVGVITTAGSSATLAT
jgi:hypothetical protein